MDKTKGLEDAAKVYASFVESFQGPPGASSLHPAARIAQANQRLTGLPALPPHLEVGLRAGWSQVAPNPALRNASIAGREFTPASRPGLAPGFVPPVLPVVPVATRKPEEPPKKSGRGTKKRNIDAFLEEMKRRDEMREQHIDPDAVVPSHLPPALSTPYLASPPLSLLETPRPQAAPLLPFLKFPLQIPPPLPSPATTFSQGSHDVGDPTTTNLYVGNLPPEVTEQILAKEFGVYGDIASVKIMWPRTEEEHARRRNCGFVSYMERKDAEEAVEKLRELVLFGSPIRVGWGKPVALPQTPLFVCSDPNRQRATPLPLHIQATGGFVTAADPTQAQKSEELVVEIPAGHPRFEITLPRDPYLLFLINRMSLYVSKMGQNFEKLVMEREVRDPRFAFLFMIQSPEHMYYRWKTYSLSQKDTMDKWRTAPFQMIVGGPFWIPPPLASVSRSRSLSQSRSKTRSRSSSQSRSSSRSSSRSRSRSRSRERKERKIDKDKPKVKGWDVKKPEGDIPKQPIVPNNYVAYKPPTSLSSSSFLPPHRNLRPLDAEKFEDMLRDLTTDRQSIKEGMAFALDHAEHAKEIVDILTDSMCILETPVPKKIARLFLISDILHNSSLPVKNASAYRSAFQTSLKTVFEGLSEKYASLEGRMTAQAMKDKVESVLNAWHAWSVFPSSLMSVLEAWKDVKRRKPSGDPSTSNNDNLGNGNGQEVDKLTQSTPSSVTSQGQLVVEEVQKPPQKKTKLDKVEILGGVPLGTYEDSSDDEKSATETNDDDVDGVPLNSSLDDVDGVPLSEPKTVEKRKKRSGLGGTMYADSDSDDPDEIDGAPL